MLKNEILEQVAKFEEQIIKLRQQFHQIPELGFQEFATAELITETLLELGLEVETEVANTGVVSLLRAGEASEEERKTILLRADMDALPIKEETGLDYTSQNDGVMHACGHDAHIAILLGAAMVLGGLKDKFNGNIKFVFQPAEEDQGGAELMIAQGVLENPKVDAALGLHVWGLTSRGIMEYKVGPFMAAPDIFSLEIFGQGGHAAQPNTCIDPIPIAAQIINNFQNIISRQIDPLESAVISVCKLESGTTHNVIPEVVTMEGTVRSLTPEIRQEIPKKMEEIVENITQMYGAEYEFDYVFRFPPLVNDAQMTELTKRSAQEILGSQKVREAKKPSMGGEDFAYFAKEVPACFFFLGIGPEDGKMKHHQPKFVVDDSVLKDGVAVLVQTVIDFLQG